MANRKTAQEKLEELKLKQEQLKAQQKALENRIKSEERKKRTHRLIEVGAEVEAALGYPLDSPEARKALGDFLRAQEARGKWVTKAIDEAKKVSAND